MNDMHSLMRSVMNFYQSQDLHNPIVIERVNEGSAERMVLSRLERAIFDECDEGCTAMPTRYAIWAENIRGLALKARDEVKQGNGQRAEELINTLINSMGAYIDAQLIIDSRPGYMNFRKPEFILESYLEALKDKSFEHSGDAQYTIENIKELLTEGWEL